MANATQPTLIDTKYQPTLNHLPLRERPASRVTDQVSSCNLVELLAAIIGGPEQIEIAHALLGEFGDLSGLMRATSQEIQAVDGMGVARTARLIAALELSLRKSTQERMQIKNPSEAALLLLPKMENLDQENFVVVLLNTRNRIMSVETVYVGNVDRTNVRIAEVFKDAVKRNATAIIVAHNHPSGDPSPSSEDVRVTEAIVSAGDLLNIDVLDHLVIGRGSWVSMHQRGMWPS
jgi:DNA repair protein RadC